MDAETFHHMAALEGMSFSLHKIWQLTVWGLGHYWHISNDKPDQAPSSMLQQNDESKFIFISY